MDKSRYLLELSNGDRTDFSRVRFDRQPHDQKVFSAVTALEGAVNGDGFASYVDYEWESSCFVLEALEAIGAPHTADIVRRALQTVSGHPLVDGRVQVDQADLTEAEEDALADLDSEFFQYPDDLTELLFAYVAARPESFGPVPEGL